MKFYHDNSVIKHGADLSELDISFQSKLVVGKFIDRERPTFIEGVNKGLRGVLKDKFVEYGGPIDDD